MSDRLRTLINPKDPSQVLRAALGVLLALNLIAAGLVMYPPGGSPEQLQKQLQQLQADIQQGKAALQRSRVIAAKVDRGRTEGDQFMKEYFLDGKTTYSTIVSELVGAGKRANIKAKDHSYITEPIEGSDDLTMMSITGAYEGSYSDLLHFVNEIDRTKRLLIIENLAAQPQQGAGGMLNIAIKFDTFVKELPAAIASAPGAAVRGTD
jgi:Tfp pilus assembly protein PilO